MIAARQPADEPRAQYRAAFTSLERELPGAALPWLRELVWDPPWSRERMSEAARLELGML